MSARAWQARKPGPYHLTAKQKRKIVARRREQTEMRRAIARVNAHFGRVSEALRQVGQAAEATSLAIAKAGGPR